MCLWIFRKKYPVISSLYGQHTDTAEDIHISTIGFEGNPKEWYISMRIYGEKFDDLLHGKLLLITISIRQERNYVILPLSFC